MRIGIKFEDDRFDNLDISNPAKGNPGIGGTAYEEILLAYLLSDSGAEVYLYHTNGTNILPKSVRSRRVDHILKIPKQARMDKADLLIFSASRTDAWYDEIDKNRVCSIAWAHCYLNYFEIRRIQKSSFVKRVIFVGRQQYYAYIADDIIEKSDYIYNIYESGNFPYDTEGRKEHQAVYLGSLYRYKGFHILAKAWKAVLQEVPDAELIVIGNGRLYGREMKLGKYGLAQKAYERKFVKYLKDQSGAIHKSVHFLGIVGNEKNKIMAHAAVGIANPSGITETFCISAVEMESCGLPVCTAGKFGLLDTVINEKTGLFSGNSKQLASNIVTMFKNEAVRKEYGRNAVRYVKKFQGNKILPKWMQVFDEILNNRCPVYESPVKNDTEIKIKKVLRKIRFDLNQRWVPSFIFFEILFKGMPVEWIRNILDRLSAKKELKND